MGERSENLLHALDIARSLAVGARTHGPVVVEPRRVGRRYHAPWVVADAALSFLEPPHPHALLSHSGRHATGVLWAAAPFDARAALRVARREPIVLSSAIAVPGMSEAEATEASSRALRLHASFQGLTLPSMAHRIRELRGWQSSRRIDLNSRWRRFARGQASPDSLGLPAETDEWYLLAAANAAYFGKARDVPDKSLIDRLLGQGSRA